MSDEHETKMKLNPQYMQAAEEIYQAAQRFKELAGDDSERYVGDAEDGFVSKIPVSVYCLKVAHQLWAMMLHHRLHQECHQQQQQQVNPASFQFIPQSVMQEMMGMMGQQHGQPGKRRRRGQQQAPAEVQPTVADIVAACRGGKIDPAVLAEAAEIMSQEEDEEAE